MQACCVLAYTSGYDHRPLSVETGSVSLHRFPSDPVESAKWVRHIHRDNFTATDHSRICSKHFAKRNETVNFAVDETASFKHIKELYRKKYSIENGSPALSNSSFSNFNSTCVV